MTYSLVDSTSLRDARSWLASKLSEGAKCPCCGQHAETYKRTVTAAMVRTMGEIWRRQEYPHEFRRGQHRAAEVAMWRGEYWVRLSAIPQKSRDVASAAYWHLIQQHPTRRGWWRVTYKGYAFLNNTQPIEKYAHVFNGEVRGYSGPAIGVREVEPMFRVESIREEGAA